MIGVAAPLKQPALFSKLILVGPSPCYINDGDYFGRFSTDQIDELLEFLDNNHKGWSAAMAPRTLMASLAVPERTAAMAWAREELDGRHRPRRRKGSCAAADGASDNSATCGVSTKRRPAFPGC